MYVPFYYTYIRFYTQADTQLSNTIEQNVVKRTPSSRRTHLPTGVVITVCAMNLKYQDPLFHFI